MRLLGVLVAVSLTSAAFGDLLDEDLNSTNPDVTISDISGFVVDDILGVEVAEKFGQDWVWPAISIDFGPVDISAGNAELDITSRIHREIGTYDDAHLWVLAYDADGTEWDLGWGPNWDGDSWGIESRDLGSLPGGDFDATQFAKILVRSTNWGGDVGVDYYHFSHLTITPEPASLFLLALGGLALIRRR